MPTADRWERQYRGLVDILTDAVFLVSAEAPAGGTILEANAAAAALHGCREGDLVGKLFSRLHGPETEPWISQVRAQGGAQLQTEHLRADGTRRPVQLRATRIPGAGPGQLLVVAHDLTGSLAVEQATREREALLAEVEQLANVGSWDWDALLQKTHWSTQLRSFLDFDPSAPPLSIEQFVEEFVLPDERVEWLKRWHQSLQQPHSISWEGRIRKPSGLIRHVRCRTHSEHTPQGTVRRVMGTVQDITEWKEGERLRLSLEKQIQQALKLDALGSLAGGIAHDFNNILGAIMGNAEVAQMDIPPNHPAAEAVADVIQASKRARELVRRILSFSRQEEGTRSTISIDELLQESIGQLRATIPPEIQIVRELEEGLPPVLGDASQLQQILVNLCSNAVYAMRGRGGRLLFRLRRHVVPPTTQRLPGGLQPGTYLRLTVADTGEGMSPEVLSRVFEPFFSTHPSKEHPGLGLAVAHGVVKGHGGVIEAESEPGRGTSFHAYFPALPVRPSSGAEPPLPRGNGERILVVDDEIPVLESLKRMLLTLGYQPRTETSPEAALRQLTADPRAFEGLIIDLSMPGMSGLELATHLRRLCIPAPVILNTGFLSAEEAEALRSSIMGRVLTKPNTLRELAEALSQVFTP